MLTTVKKDTVNYKFVLVGDSAVGKSSVAHRYISNDFYEFQEPTIGAAFMAKKLNIDDREVRLEIWDTAGQERYRSLAPMYYRNASVALVVYDITQKSSFEGAQSWIEEILRRASDNCIILLLGNKSDLENEIKVDENEVNNYVRNKDILHFKTSAKTGLNIKRIFNTTINKLVEENKEGIIKQKNLNDVKVNNTNCC
jgi:small GTP-binding protein